MDILYANGEGSVQEVLNRLPDPPSYSAVRALLTTMVEKGHLKQRKESRKFLYSPAVPEEKAKRSALGQILATFFDGRPDKLVASLLDPKDQELSAEEIDSIRALIRKNGKGEKS